MNTTKYKITILGAGSIGCFIGGMLMRDGHALNFIGRQKLGKKIQQGGMALSAHDENTIHLEGSKICWNDNPASMNDSDIVLVCTKSVDTQNSAELINVHTKPEALIVSVQNGVGNVQVLAGILPRHKILSAMVSFNVARLEEDPQRFHRGTDGEVIFEQHHKTQELVASLNCHGVGAATAENMKPIGWGKLLMNLNNAVNVISDLPLKRQLENRYWRLVFGASVREALKVLKAAGITPAKIGKAPPALLPFILQLPNPLFNLIAGGMLKIDDTARSSMWEDLQAGRQPEIEFLNGAICRLGKDTGFATPINDLMVKLVRDKFNKPDSAQVSSEAVLELISNVAPKG